MKQDRYRALQRRSDDHLVSRRFRTDEPEEEPNLLPKAPDDIAGAIVESFYERRKDEPAVRCRQCRETHWKANHRHGYVIRLPNGDGLLIGKACGAKHYGTHWSSLTKQFNDQRTRQNYLRRRRDIEKAWPAADAELASLLKKTWPRRYDIGVRSFRERLPRLHALLVWQLTSAGPTIYRDVRVRDIRAEENAKASREGEPIFTLVPMVVGRISGPEFISVGTELEQTIEKGRSALSRRVKLLMEANTEDLPDRALGAMVRAVEGGASRIEKALRLLDALEAFGSADNLRMICAWASGEARGGGSYHYDGKGIEWSPPASDSVRWAIPLTGRADLPALQRLIANG
jgi:hypothetical protein